MANQPIYLQLSAREQDGNSSQPLRVLAVLWLSAHLATTLTVLLCLMAITSSGTLLSRLSIFMTPSSISGTNIARL